MRVKVRHKYICTVTNQYSSLYRCREVNQYVDATTSQPPYCSVPYDQHTALYTAKFKTTKCILNAEMLQIKSREIQLFSVLHKGADYTETRS